MVICLDAGFDGFLSTVRSSACVHDDEARTLFSSCIKKDFCMLKFKVLYD